ncbi:hypothetical protein [Arthrobacter sp. NPDC056727]|uniref:hypothetical protein n=1 Tax=Arthrobacter sp. NPDC056727 TaxID=3345927 RepID=UPI00366CB31C
MSNEYQLVDGSPRYGTRHDETPQDTGAAQSPRVEETAEAAARLGLDHVAAAIDRRLTSPWAEKEDAVQALRAQYPEELASARALVRLHLGSQRQWRLKAQAVRDKQLAATMHRRRMSGRAREIFLLRLGLMLALIAPPVYVLTTSREDILKLVLTGVVCIAAAFVGGHFLTVRARVPVMPNIRGTWLAELRNDVINATLVAILQNKGVELDRMTVAAGQRGWDSITTAAKAVDALQG